jgi:hypothetical protein
MFLSLQDWLGGQKVSDVVDAVKGSFFQSVEKRRANPTQPPDLAAKDASTLALHSKRSTFSLVHI